MWMGETAACSKAERSMCGCVFGMGTRYVAHVDEACHTR